MARQLPLAHAEHAAVIEDGRRTPYALIDVEEHDEEHQRHAERDLGPDAEPEPQREDRRQHHAWQRVDHLDVGIEHRGEEGVAREPEADQHAADPADHKGEDRFPQRDERCFQITPVENHFKTWLPTSIGLEKKNGGNRIRPNTGTVGGRATSPARRRRPAIAVRGARSSTRSRSSHVRTVTAWRRCRPGWSHPWRDRPAP